MFTTKNLAIALMALSLAVVGVVTLKSSPKGQLLGGAYTQTNLGSATSSAAFAITASARIIATSTSLTGTSYTRVFASICNPNANPVVINMNSDKAADRNSGQVTTVIAAAAGYNACYEITDRNASSGSVTASSTNETSTTITVQQFVQ